MLFILLLFKLSIKICLIELFSTAVLRLSVGLGVSGRKGAELELASRTCHSKLWPVPCPRRGTVTEESVFCQKLCRDILLAEIVIKFTFIHLFLHVKYWNNSICVTSLQCCQCHHVICMKLHCVPKTPFHISYSCFK